MSNTKGYFNLLSKILSEENVFDSAEGLEIDSLFNSLYKTVDEDLMSAVERICYSEKYDIISEIKAMLLKYRLLLYFPELIGKAVVSFYSVESLSALLTKNFGLEQCAGLFKKNMWIPNEVPCVFSDREETDIRFINLSETPVSVEMAEYRSIKKLVEKKFEPDSLMVMMSAAIKSGLPNIAFIGIPDGADNMYVSACADFTDILVTDGSSLEKLTGGKLKKFGNLKHLYILGDVPEKQKQFLVELSNNPDITVTHIRSGEALSELLRADFSLQMTSNNTCLAMRIDTHINEILSYLAARIIADKNKIKPINEELLLGSNSKILDTIHSLRDAVNSSIDENTALFKNLCSVRDDIFKISCALEQIVSSVNAAETGEESELNVFPHFNTNVLICELYIQYCPYAAVHRAESKKRDKYREMVSSMGEEFALAAEAFAGNAKVGRSVEMLNFLSVNSSDIFVQKAQLIYANQKNADINVIAQRAFKLGDNCVTPLERYYRGIYNMNTDRVLAENDFRFALESGLTDAGKMLMQLDGDSISAERLKSLADMLVPDACYMYGHSILQTFMSAVEKAYFNISESDIAFVSNYLNGTEIDEGIFYLKVSAASGNANSVIELALMYHRLYTINIGSTKGDERRKTFFSMAVSYEKQLLDKKYGSLKISNYDSVYEMLCDILYRHKDYIEAKEYAQKADTGYANWVLGLIYENGYDCAVDLDEALKCFSISKTKGYSSAAAAYDRVAAAIAAAKKKQAAAESTSYASYSYYSGGYYSDYYSGYSSGCVKQGTKILCADGRLVNVEDMVKNTSVINCCGLLSYTSDELVVNREVEMLYSVNDDAPFMSPEHAIMTQRGWCSLDPQLSMSINRFYKVYKLELGDTFRKAVWNDGKIEYTDCTVNEINIVSNTEKAICYDLHFFDGYNSYYANGYPCLLNYPEFTLASLTRNTGIMTPAEKDRFYQMATEYRDTLEIIFGKNNIDILFMNRFNE